MPLLTRANASLILLALSITLGGCDNHNTNAASGAKESAAKTTEKSSPKVLPLGTTAQQITLKGIPFDQPGVKEEIQKLCVIPKSFEKDPSFVKSMNWCKFDDKGNFTLPDFGYGNLPTGLTASWGKVKINDQGALVRFEIDGSKGHMLELAVILEEKHGKPLVAEEQVSNQLGTKFDKKTFTWTDEQGTRITVESIYGKIDNGRVLIESKSMIKLISDAAQFRKSIAKDNL
jgi:hypothetical protein